MAANATVALGKELGNLKSEYDKLQKHLYSVEKTYSNLISTDKNQDGDIPLPTRLQRMAAELFSSEMFSDIVVLLQGGIQVKAHKFVLAASGNDWGVNGFDKVDMLDLTDMRYEVCHAMIKWVYTDEFDFHHKINDDFLIELMQAASICKLESLFIRCQKALTSILNNENCEKYLQISEELECKILKEQCIKIYQQKQDALKPEKTTKVVKPGVKTFIPSSKQGSPRVVKAKSPRSSDQKTPDQIKIISTSDNKKRDETAEAIFKTIEKSILQKELPTSAVIPAVHEDSNGLPMDDKLKTEMANTADVYIEYADEDDNDDGWENMDIQIPETPSKVDDPNSSKRTENSPQSGVENSVDEEGNLVNGNENSDKNPEGETFPCDVCDKSFKKKDYLTKHKVIHEPFKPHKCADCSKTFHTQGDLKKHMKGHHTNQFQCEECGKSLRSAAGFAIHKATHIPGSGVQCKICNQFLRNKTILTNHMSIHTGEKNHKCDVCNKSFRQKCTLNSHKKIHSGLKPFMCEVCGKSFVDAVHLKRHKPVHIKGRHFHCNKCDKSFRQKSTLNKHYMKHESTYRCDYCTKILLSAEEYHEHRNTHLAPGQKSETLPEKVIYTPKSFCCEICGKTMQNKYLLNSHMSVHTGERPFVCQVCNKTFRTKQLYQEHTTLHTGEQPHACDVCGKSFRLYSTMASHKKTHNTELSYTCDVCGKGFTTSSYLRKHKVSHRPDKPYKCDLCGIGFRFASARNVHRKDHDVTARGGYECPTCGKRGFQSMSWFNAHKKKCRETPKNCSVCGFLFSRSHNYKHHMAKYGDINPHYQCSKCVTIFTHLHLLKHHECNPKERVSCPYCPAVVMGRLKRHLESVHPEKVDLENMLSREETKTISEKFTCPFCEIPVLTINSLKRHIRTVHKDVQVSKVTRDSVSIVPATSALVKIPQKTEQEVVTQELLDWNTIFPETHTHN